MAKSAMLLNRKEAAQLSGASPATINKAIEQRVVGTRSAGRRSLIDARDVGALKLFAGLSFGLPVKEKRRLSAWLRTAPLGAEESLGPGVVVRKTATLDEVTREATRYAELKERFLEIDARKQGGEPVIRGTRVPVRALAKQVEAGESVEVLRREYDFVDPEAFDFAVMWSRANPRRGRPAIRTTGEEPGSEPPGRRAAIERRRRAAGA